MLALQELGNILSGFEIGTLQQVTLLDAASMQGAHMPSFPPHVPALIMGVEQSLLQDLTKVLLLVYPSTFAVRVLDAKGALQEMALSKLPLSGAAHVYLPALGTGASFEAFQEIIAHLRAPEDGCPWDKEQTHLTLRKHLLEEAYETLSAMDEEDPQKMREEFGDLLLQIVLNAQIGSEYGGFNMTQVLQSIYDKIVRRHPHVFGEVSVDGVGDVLANWEMIKASERKKEGNQEKGILDGLPPALPALVQAQEFQARAARVGFDWPEIDGVLAKVNEEISEVQQATNPDELSDELGDLFFALVNLARWKKIDAESALRAASLKFKKRFKYIEKRVHEMEKQMQDLSLAQLDDLWNEAKRNL